MGDLRFGARPSVGFLVGVAFHDLGQPHAYGTRESIDQLIRCIDAVHERYPKSPKMYVGHFSARRGGRLKPHKSHQAGRDVDVSYYYSTGSSWYQLANAKNLDVPRTWALIKGFVDTDEVTYIFMDHRIQKLLYEYALSKGVDEDTLDELFQYPRGRGRSHGIIRHWRGHANHFHVRFRP